MTCRATKLTVLGVLCYAASLAAAPELHAFSDPQVYADPVDLGGGAGRWFTGSSAEGYGCDVCHVGKAGADLVVAGIPDSGYVPGRPYEVSITWPVDILDVALVAEFTDEERRGAGTLALPRPETLKPGELCAEDQGDLSPAQLHDAEGGRSLVSVVDCGARMVRFQWTAPPLAAGTLWFHAGFVASNQDATPAGDGVTLVRRPIAPAGESDSARTIAQGSCAAAGSRTGSPGLALAAVIAVALRVRRRVRGEKP